MTVQPQHSRLLLATIYGTVLWLRQEHNAKSLFISPEQNLTQQSFQCPNTVQWCQCYFSFVNVAWKMAPCLQHACF